MSNVAFIGLGVMGYPMAGYISKAGHNVTVYNRTAAKADKWITEYKWIAWIGLIAILVVAIELIYTDLKLFI